MFTRSRLRLGPWAIRTTAILPLLTVLLVGCASVPFKGGQSPADASAVAGATTWPFIPVTLRVHPFTTITKPADAPLSGGPTGGPSGGPSGKPSGAVLEARIELIDRLGDVTKGVGQLRFELYLAPASASQRGQDHRIAFWDVPLDSLNANAQHWDPITRTYLFRLSLDTPPPPSVPLRLQVQFTDPGGKRLTADGTLEYRPPGS